MDMDMNGRGDGCQDKMSTCMVRLCVVAFVVLCTLSEIEVSCNSSRELQNVLRFS
jgi:hypothetical protein